MIIDYNPFFCVYIYSVHSYVFVFGHLSIYI